MNIIYSFLKKIKGTTGVWRKNAELLEAEKNVEYYTKELERMKTGYPWNLINRQMF